MLNEQQISNFDNQKTKSVKNTPYKVLGGLILIVVVGLIIAYFTGFFDKNKEFSSSAVDNGQLQTDNIVARVNGLAITESEVSQRSQIIVSGLQAPGAQITDDQLAQAQQFALQQLVNESLILQAADQDNISVSSEEVQVEFDKIVANYPDEQSFQQDLTASNVTEQQVRADIARQLTIQKYINANTNSQGIEVTSDEVEQLYSQLSQQQPDVPELEQVRNQLEQRIFQDKLNQQIDQLITDLRTSANIEIIK